jgi:probable HAF family extracellular repeat protein
MPRAAATFQLNLARLIVFAAIAGIAPSAIAQSFHLTGFVPPQLGSHVYGLSADGSVAAGYDSGAGFRGFTWTTAGGRNNFGLSFATFTSVYGISGNGLAVVGAGPTNAFKWSQAGGYQNLGVLPGYSLSEARDANSDGSIVVGTLSNGSGSEPQAFRWTQTTGMQGLGFGTRANQISGNGSTIVGTLTDQPRAMQWTQAGGLQMLPSLAGSGDSHARAVNFDGTLIVGNSGPTFRPTMWISGSPIELLSAIPNSRMTPFGVSDNGSVAAGQVQDDSGSLFAGVWTPETLTMRLDEYLVANGVSIPAGVTLTTCTAVSGLRRHDSNPLPRRPRQRRLTLTNGGTRDRAVTIDDLLFLLTAFESGNLAADLDNGSTGTPAHATTP